MWLSLLFCLILFLSDVPCVASVDPTLLKDLAKHVTIDVFVSEINSWLNFWLTDKLTDITPIQETVEWSSEDEA